MIYLVERQVLPPTDKGGVAESICRELLPEIPGQEEKAIAKEDSKEEKEICAKGRDAERAESENGKNLLLPACQPWHSC